MKWSFISLEAIWRDIRYGVRGLAKEPGFTIVAVLTIALGIGVNTGIFSLFNGVALRLLPIPHADQVVSIHQIFHGNNRHETYLGEGLFSYPEYQEYRNHNHVFSGLLAYAPLPMEPLGGERVQFVLGTSTSCNYFEVLEERPTLGRGFVDEDCNAQGAHAVVVLSDDLWHNAFGADPAIIGKSISLNRATFTVIGIAPKGFAGTEPIQSMFWTPASAKLGLCSKTDYVDDNNFTCLVLLGRAREGVSITEVRTDLAVIAARDNQLHPGETTTLDIHEARLLSRPEERRTVLAIATVILVAVGLVLLISCANVANLLLARASVRHREIAVRLSLGASHWRIIQQLLTESLLISLLGGILGSLFGLWSFQVLSFYILSHLPSDFPPLALNLRPDLRVLSYSMALTLFSGIVFGLAPALHAVRRDLSTTIKDANPSPSGKTASGAFLRNTLVGLQVAVCMVLLIAAGLLMRGLYLAQTIKPGLEMKDILQTKYYLLMQDYKTERAAAFQRQLIERVAALPGVDGVAQVRVIPLSGDYAKIGFQIPSQTDSQLFDYNLVSPGFFSMLGIPIVRGRSFTEAETRANAQVIIVSESLARHLWPGQDALGKVLRRGKYGEFQIVGIVKDALGSRLDQSDKLCIYMPASPNVQLFLELLVHTRGGYETTTKGILDAAHRLDADLVVEVSKLDDNLEIWRTPVRIIAGLSGLLGTLALSLASIGVYGVVSYCISRRIREIGIRMTLGAEERDVMRVLLREAMRPVLIGVIVGVVCCAAVSHYLSQVLFGVGSHDFIAFIGAPMFLSSVALLASYIPVRRATQVDPAIALRYE
jgi:predicted permease